MSDEDKVLSDDDVLAYTQGIRRRYIDFLAPDGQFPQDQKDQRLMLTALADMDRSALANKRIQSEDKMADADQALANILIKITQQHGNMVRPSQDNPGRIPESRPDLLPEIEPVPGQMGENTVVDYEEIVKDGDDDETGS